MSFDTTVTMVMMIVIVVVNIETIVTKLTMVAAWVDNMMMVMINR